MDRHLTEYEIAQYLEALCTDTLNQLPEEVREYVAEYLKCKVEIVEVLAL